MRIRMKPRIELLTGKKLVGMKMEMTFSDNKTGELWRNFMQRRKEIKNRVSDELYSMQVYGQSFNFKDFNPNAPFEKWAAAGVTDFNSIPDKMEPFVLKGGLYAVFIHKGPASDGPRTFRHIFVDWLPASGFQIDNRPHFEILGAKYKNEDPDSEEEVWIPVKPQ
jgi:AraC family transcriptional regulator